MTAEVRIRWDRQHGCAVDLFGRDAARCRAEAAAAASAADAVRGVVAAIESGQLRLGREGGAKMVKRFELNGAQLAAIAERDLRHAAALAEADSEMQERRSA